jgi:hypothetical protein
MTVSDDRLDRARDQFELVSGDTDARDRFAAAFVGAGDPIAALREAAGLEEHSDEERRQCELRRKIAFARPRSAAEAAAAVEARRALAEEEARQLANAEAVDRAIRLVEFVGGPTAHVSPPSPVPDAPSPIAGATPREPSRIRRIWLLPIILVSVASGYFGATVSGIPAAQSRAEVSASALPSSSPTPFSHIERLPPVISIRPGDLAAAKRWFDRPATERDKFVNLPSLKSMGVAESDIRLVRTDPDGFGVWVASKPDGSLCLLGTSGTESVFGGCVTAQQFARTGLHVVGGGRSLDWDGNSLEVSGGR